MLNAPKYYFDTYIMKSYTEFLAMASLYQQYHLYMVQ